ncbi:MAG: hypothetical protein V7L25_32610 [Nostoc sp.]
MLKSDATCFKPKDPTPVAHGETPFSTLRFALAYPKVEKALASHEWEKTVLALQRSGSTFQNGFF